MGRFLGSRLLFYIAAFMVAVTFNFVLPRMMPGDPFEIMFAAAQGKIQPEQMAVLKEQFGFVAGPWHVQFWDYVKGIFSGDLGPSLTYYPTPVTEIIAGALPWTVFLAGTATLISLFIGISFGIFAAYNRGGKFDSMVAPTLAFVGAFPQMVSAMLILFGLGVVLDWFPVGYGYNPDIDAGWTLAFFLSVAYHAALPLITMVITGIGGWLFLMRNSMINTLGEDYITMGKAKGLSTRRVMVNYAARNAALPVVTAVAMALSFVVAGALLIELIYNYPGLGNEMLGAVAGRDYPLLQGLLLIIVVCVLTANFLADLAYFWLDPRLRKQ